MWRSFLILSQLDEKPVLMSEVEGSPSIAYKLNTSPLWRGVFVDIKFPIFLVILGNKKSFHF
tara:strand:+ start:60 stop:245 length:186 start_codon:yes stop_codon:yes gene_type:complete